MRITLSEQIAEAETHRDAIAAAVAQKPAMAPRLDRSEGIVLTLRLLETVEPQFRDFMRTLHTNPYMGE